MGKCARRHDFWHSEGWTPRNEALLEAVLKRARVTKLFLLMACDADLSSVEFEKSLWFQRNGVHVVAPEKASTCRSNGAKGELIDGEGLRLRQLFAIASRKNLANGGGGRFRVDAAQSSVFSG